MASRAELKKWIAKVLSFREVDLKNEQVSTEIRQLIGSAEEAKILEAVEFVSNNDVEQLVPLVTNISAGLLGDNPACPVKRKKLIRSLIAALRDSRFNKHVSAGVLLFLFSEINYLKTADIMEFLRDFKRAFERGLDKDVGIRYVDVFPKLLHALDKSKLSGGDSNEPESKETFLNAFCQPPRDENETSSGEPENIIRWHPSSVVHILMALKDANITAEQRAWTVAKTIDLFPRVDVEELPNVIYELIRLTSGTDRVLALNGILEHFTAKDKSEKDEAAAAADVSSTAIVWQSIKRCEGFVLLHIMHAARLNYDAGKTIVNVLKGKGRELLLPFNFGILMALTQASPRLKDQALETAKSAILQYLKIAEKKENSTWIHSSLGIEVDIEGLMKRLAETSEHELGWEYALLGLRELGFVLLDSHLPKLVILAGGKLAAESPNSVGYNACTIGKSIIIKCYVAYDVEKRQTLIKQLFKSITVPNASGSLNAALFYIDVMASLVMRGPAAFVALEEHLAEMFDLLPRLPYEVGVPMVKALLPVIKLRPTLRDALVSSLQKAIFFRTVDAKKTAVGGFLFFLKHFKIMNNIPSGQGSSQSSYCHSFPSFGSQVLPDPRTDPQRVHYERLCMEVIGCLRRTLSLQGEIKEVLYYGFCSVVRRNVSTLQPVLEFLNRHLQQHLEKLRFNRAVEEPLKLSEWVQTTNNVVTTTEAFGWLIYALTRILKQAEDDKKKLEEGDDEGDEDIGNRSQELYFNYNMVSNVRGILWKLSERMAKLEGEDVGVDKLTDYSATATGEKNVKMAKLLLSTHEAIMEFLITFFDFKRETADMILNLFVKHQDLKRDLERATSTKAKKAAVAGGAAATVGPKSKPPFGQNDSAESIDISVLNLSSLLEMATYLFRDQSPNRREALVILREDKSFVPWILDVILEKIKNLSVRRKADSSGTFETICKISALMHQYHAEDANIVVEMKRAQMKHLKLVALDIVVAVLDLVNVQFADKLEEAFQIWGSALDPSSQVSSQQYSANLATYGKTFQRHLKDLLVKRAEVTPNRRRGGTAAAAPEDEHEKEEHQSDESSPRHLLSLIKIIDTVLKYLPRTSDHFGTAYQFMLGLCEEQAVKDASIAKALWLTVLRMHRRMNADGNPALVLATNIRSSLGSNADENPPEPEPACSSVNSKTAASVVPALHSILDEWRQDCAFLIDHLRRELALAKSRKDLDWTPNEALDGAICNHLKTLGDVWVELARSSLQNAHVHTTIKLLHEYFDSCNVLIRYYSGLHQSKLGGLTETFVELAQFIGSEFTCAVYKFISLAECAASMPDKTKKPIASAAKQALRESKEVAGLVFAAETSGKCLLELSSKSKEKSLIRGLYYGHNRDFQIQYEKLEEAVAAVRNGDGDEENEEDENTRGTEEFELVDENEAEMPMENDATTTKKRKAAGTKVGEGQKTKKPPKTSPFGM